MAWHVVPCGASPDVCCGVSLAMLRVAWCVPSRGLLHMVLHGVCGIWQGKWCVSFGVACGEWHFPWHVVCDTLHGMFCVAFGRASGV